MEGRKTGVHIEYTDEKADMICELVATSTLGLSKLCKLHPELPSKETIFKWRYRHAYMADHYAEAKRKQAELLAEEILDISDDGINDTYIDDDGNSKTDVDVLQRSRLRIDTRKWIACKLLPKVYGQTKPTQGEDEDTLISQVVDKL